MELLKGGNINNLTADYRPSLRFSSGRRWDVVGLVASRWKHNASTVSYFLPNLGQTFAGRERPPPAPYQEVHVSVKLTVWLQALSV